MIENLVYNTNRIIIGFFILLFFIISFLFNLEKYFFFLIVLFNFLELHKSKILNYYSFFISSFFFILFIIIFNLNFFALSYLIILNLLAIFLILICIFNYPLINFFFLIIITIFLINFYELIKLENYLFYKLLIISFVNDTFAYFVGSNIKGPLITPKISPNKTWSGTISAFFLTMILLSYIDINIYFSIILSLSLFFGDLLFSFIKRKLNLKDFSNLLKSHGGILDRFDSFFLFITIYNLIFALYHLL